uniref:Uncharacterized protein n=1 Tax=Oryza nivara TaxID=4536 RepID=A0A679BCH3_ORYNI|nr:hypothetical protein [Oryza sativa f. spontanea]
MDAKYDRFIVDTEIPLNINSKLQLLQMVQRCPLEVGARGLGEHGGEPIPVAGSLMLLLPSGGGDFSLATVAREPPALDGEKEIGKTMTVSVDD